MNRIPVVAASLLLLASTGLFAADKFSFNFRNAPLTKVVEKVSEITGKRFVFEGQTEKVEVTVVTPDKLTAEQVFNAFALALSGQGLAMTRQGDFYKIASARNLQRDMIEVHSDLPENLEPQRLITWIARLKHANASELNKNVRIFLSRDGEMSVQSDANLLVFTDWISNLHRVRKVIAELDQPVASKPATKSP